MENFPYWERVWGEIPQTRIDREDGYGGSIELFEELDDLDLKFLVEMEKAGDAGE